MTSLIDTDWVVDDLTGIEQARDLLVGLLPGGMTISIISYVEIVEGIVGGRDTVGVSAIFRELLREIAVVGVSEPIATGTARLRAELRRPRRQVNHRSMHLIIAASAIELDFNLVSRNNRHYDDIPGLRLNRGQPEG